MKILSGCIVAVWHILVTLPMWLVLLFGILHTVNAPPWMWCLYWCYVPASVLGGIFVSMFKWIGDGD